VIGRNRLELSRLIFGAAPIGGLYAPVAAAVADATLEAAWAAGVRAFDTAPHYGAGLSEQRLGTFLAGRKRDEFALCTKVGRLLVPTDDDVDGVDDFYGTPQLARVRDFSRDGVLRSLEASLRRLRVDRVEMVLIHDPDEHLEQAIEQAYPALDELRREGVVDSIGVGMNHTAPLERFVRETDIDCILVAGRYSLLDATAAESLLPECSRRGVLAFVAGVFGSGVLADPRPGARYDYAPASAEVIARAERIRATCDRHGVSLRAAAMRFPLRHSAVSAVVVGARSPQEIAEDIADFESAVPDALWEDLVELG
jgi:D-threo-aldose 1-dehydrogenase